MCVSSTVVPLVLFFKTRKKDLKKKALHRKCKLGFLNLSTSILHIAIGSSPFISDILHQGLPKQTPTSWRSKLCSTELGCEFDKMHSQHEASHTNVSLLQIKVKLELHASNFFRALHKIASTTLTAKYMCNWLFSPKTELHLFYCYMLLQRGRI